ncbi:hypothetical protein FBEOM_4972 [Fusarium beomiforme]|uniref:Uncharacterized protein n=1 Tax=Fusarium beomiforme TaxID=44412 RepID=A0A9P5ALV8_9HYPO|nr:hypothetical protein FBEOM_4972 [Fusarium beomiforme]
MSRLRQKVLPVLAVSSLPSSHITSAPDISWTKVGPGKDHVLSELESLYWDGVKAELENIVRTLKAWQQPEFVDVSIEDENDDHVHGFDTFLDSVSQQSRAHAIRYGKMRQKQSQLMKGYSTKHMAYGRKTAREALLDTISDRIAQQASDHIKADVRESIQASTRLKGMEYRAWILLQAAGFLDMEKLIEHRPPPDMFGFWKRPAIPQLALSTFSDDWTPNFESLRCMRKQCKKVVRGSMFIRNDAGSDPGIICEECYRNHYYGKGPYTKAYKHCILSETITPEISRKICTCAGMLESNDDESLFPISRPEGHSGFGKDVRGQCKVLQLGDMVALAKYHGLQSSVGVKPRTQKEIEKAKRQARIEENRRSNWSYRYSSSTKPEMSDFEDENEPKPKKEAGPKGGRLKRMKTVQETSLNATDRSPASTNVSVAEEAAEDGDIPLFFRKYVEKYPYGNVHMALRVGPLVIENGVAHTKGGALVSLREMPIYHERFHLQTMPDRDLAIGGGLDRPVWKRKRKATGRKRYKAIMKQVVGVPFSGDYGSHDQELSIVQDLLAACEKPFDDPGLPTSDQVKLLNTLLEPVLEKLKVLLSPRLEVYLRSISERLLDQDVKLAWSATHNNCQTFCSSLIDKAVFQPLVNGEPGDISSDVSPLYTMSFVCPDEGYKRRGVRTKFDVPFGLTEEYLLRFHFGRHDESDIIDTYQEYWYDWGAFGSTLYKYQDLYPWDCTEAYGRYPTKCGDCNLAKHVWAFPFDSWSVSSHHLSRDRHMYGPALTDQDLTAVGEGATASSWMRNRLTVLSAMAVLHRAATAMAQSLKFQKATAWLHKGLTDSTLDPSLARVKLGGIHRAQPCSHYFEAGVYSHYFIAPWATLTRDKQIKAYELQRDGRAGLPDMPGYLRKRRFDGHIEWDQYQLLDFGGTSPFPDIDHPMNIAPFHHHICMDKVDGCYSDSHFSPTSETPCHVCASGCGSSTRNAADCASGETIRMAEAAAAAALAAVNASTSHSSCGGGSSSCGGGSSSCGGGSSCGGSSSY